MHSYPARATSGPDEHSPFDPSVLEVPRRDALRLPLVRKGWQRRHCRMQPVEQVDVTALPSPQPATALGQGNDI
jgi:hypothetical protein